MMAGSSMLEEDRKGFYRSWRRVSCPGHVKGSSFRVAALAGWCPPQQPQGADLLDGLELGPDGAFPLRDLVALAVNEDVGRESVGVVG